MLVLWGLNICQQSPLEARTQAVLQAVNGFGRPVAGNNDLLVGIVERIERVEKLLFCGFFPGNKLDIIDEQNINLAVLCAKLGCFL